MRIRKLVSGAAGIGLLSLLAAAGAAQSQAKAKSDLPRTADGPPDRPRRVVRVGVGAADAAGALQQHEENRADARHITILVEMNHDARVVRMYQEHLPPTVRKWMGDSVGRWEGDTLVVDPFTVDDPKTWSKPWSGQYPWPASENRVFEYACQEGNYALGNIMRGARALEQEALAKKAAK